MKQVLKRYEVSSNTCSVKMPIKIPIFSIILDVVDYFNRIYLLVLVDPENVFAEDRYFVSFACDEEFENDDLFYYQYIGSVNSGGDSISVFERIER